MNHPTRLWRSASALLLAVIPLGCVSSTPAGPEAQTPSSGAVAPAPAGVYDVRAYGAVGDGQHLDTPAINLAIAAANAAGGGTVVFHAGDYLCYSIHLQSNVELHLSPGCTVIAANAEGRGDRAAGYDFPEPNPGTDRWEDFGHSHWRNSLIWGDGLENVSITGPGLIWGRGLSNGSDRKDKVDSTDRPSSRSSSSATRSTSRPPTPHDPRDVLTGTPDPWKFREAAKNEYPNDRDSLRDGIGNKAVSLKNCRNVTFRDFSILRGGHFGFLLTGCENLTLDNVKIDTNRDGMDIDACRNVRVSNCSVNSPHDDGICLKSSYGLGTAKICEDVTIANCFVTGGYEIGTLLNGKRVRRGSGGTGRIKFGTESNGGYKRITITNCVFEYCNGLAIESVDGAQIQDVTISNIVMRDIAMSPIFIRLGNRARGPENPEPGFIRRVSINNVVASNCNWRYASIIAGLPNHPIEDLTISDVFFQYQGGGTEREAAFRPMELERHYPEPNMFGTTPSSALYIRHAKNVTMHHSQLVTYNPDARPLIWLEDVRGADFDHIKTNAPKDRVFKQIDVTDFTATTIKSGLPDVNDPATPSHDDVVIPPTPR